MRPNGSDRRTGRRRSSSDRNTGAGSDAHGDGSLDLDAFLPYRLAVTAHAVSRALSGVYGRKYDLSIAEWRVIANLGRMTELGAGALASHSSLDKAKVARAIANLETRGLVARHVPEQDRRRASLRLTGKGLAIYGEIAEEAVNWEGRLLATLNSGRPQDTDGSTRAD